MINVINFDDFEEPKFTNSKDEITIVCAATHYEGEPCDNTKVFWNWIKKLKKNRDKTALAGLRFTVFALGDKTYELYNTVGFGLDKVFEELGGTRICQVGEGNNENYKIEEHFDEWKNTLWQNMCEYYAQINPKTGELKTKKAIKENEAEELPLKITFLDDEVNVNIPSDTMNYEMAARQYMTS